MLVKVSSWLGVSSFSSYFGENKWPLFRLATVGCAPFSLTRSFRTCKKIPAPVQGRHAWDGACTPINDLRVGGLRRAPSADELGKPPNCFQDTFGRPLLHRYGIWVAGNGNTGCGFRGFEDGKFSEWPRWSLSLGSFNLGYIYII